MFRHGDRIAEAEVVTRCIRFRHLIFLSFFFVKTHFWIKKSPGAVRIAYAPGDKYSLSKHSLPVCFSEPDEDKIVTDQDWALHQHTVRCQQRKQRFLTHSRNSLAELHFLVHQAAGIEELPQRQTA